MRLGDFPGSLTLGNFPSPELIMTLFSPTDDIRIPAPAGILHIFNPETDYALASGSPYYTPPASVIALRRKLAFLPLEYALPGDYLLCLDSFDDKIIARKKSLHPGIKIISLDEAPQLFYNLQHAASMPFILPWGWNPAIRHTLALAGAPDDILPSENYIAEIRRISHRSLTVDFNRLLNDLLSKKGIDNRHLSPLPKIFTNVEDALNWEAENRPVFFKAPWSSSGRGIIFTQDLDTETHIRPLLRGFIRRQKSVLGETYADKKIDFATEFLISDNPGSNTPKVRFIGLSVFEASRRGKYHGNHSASQDSLYDTIRRFAPDFNIDFIEAQAEALGRLVPAYRGYCGIDMLADSHGAIRTCVEINFRMTMGIVTLLTRNKILFH